MEPARQLNKWTPLIVKVSSIMEDVDKDFSEYLQVIEIYNAGDRVFIKSILDAESIAYFIQGDYIAPIYSIPCQCG
jgi:hypothetical protein